MPNLWSRKPGPRKAGDKTRPARRATAVSFTATELVALARLVAVGQAVTQERPPVVARLKAALTRLGAASPKGL